MTPSNPPTETCSSDHFPQPATTLSGSRRSPVEEEPGEGVQHAMQDQSSTLTTMHVNSSTPPCTQYPVIIKKRWLQSCSELGCACALSQPESPRVRPEPDDKATAVSTSGNKAVGKSAAATAGNWRERLPKGSKDSGAESASASTPAEIKPKNWFSKAKNFVCKVVRSNPKPESEVGAMTI